METVPTREALKDLVAVPRRGGLDLAPILFGLGDHTIYRFEEPLETGKPFWRRVNGIDRLGVAPGLLFIWTSRYGQPIVLDAETGERVSTSTAPVTDIEFLDARRGAAVFVASGLSATTDGGATWRTVEPRDAVQPVSRLAHIGGSLWGSPYGLQRIDVDSATLTKDNYDPHGPSLLREQWIMQVQFDLLNFDPWSAVHDGIDLGNDTALVAVGGALAGVDLATGLGTFFPESRHPEFEYGRTGTQAGRSAWFLGSTRKGDDLKWDLLRVPLDGPHVVTEVFSFWSRGFDLDSPRIYGTTAGGLEVSPCRDSSQHRGSCVLQRDGSFAFVDAESGPGAARDGALYIVRPLNVGAPRMQLTARYANGTERPIGEFSSPGGPTRVESLDEDSDGTIHVVLAGDAVYYVRIKSGSKPEVVHLDGITSAQYRAGHGYARGPGLTMVSRGGGSWEKAPNPPESLVPLDRTPLGIVVNSLGAVEDDVYRIHWGPVRTFQPPAADDQPPTHDNASPFPHSTAPVFPKVRCQRSAAPPSPDAALGSTEFETSDPAPGLARREVSFMSQRLNVLIEQYGPNDDSALVTSWRISWLDLAEIGSHTRTWTGPAHGGWLKLLKVASARAGELALLLEDVNRHRMLLRIDATGHADARDVPLELMPLTLTFGTDKKASVGGLSGSGIFVWPKGEDPRRVAYLGGIEPLVVSSATDHSILVQTRWWDDQLTYEIPLGGQVPITPAPVVGWTKSAPPFSSGNFPKPCPKGATGAIVPWAGGFSPIEIDGQKLVVDESCEDRPEVSYELRASPSGGCAESALFLLSDGTRFRRFLRADFVRDTMETGAIDQREMDTSSLRFIRKGSVFPVTCKGF